MEHNNNENILDSYESTENALMDSFKAAALKVTTLYKDSLVQNRKAYAAGYQQALQDLYEFISAQPENGYIPVQDVLYFARQKNSQLTNEMGGASSTGQSTNHSSQSNTTSTTTAPATTNPTTNYTRSQQAQQAEEQHTKTNPFSIDPHAQFTFTHDIPIQHQQQPMSGLWDQAINTTSTDSVANAVMGKRRLNTELSFMGRSLENNWFLDSQQQQQPAFKRTRSSRHNNNTDQAAAAAVAQAQAQQAQLQLQQQQQQIQQQQQQLVLQQQQLQQLQQLQQQQQQQQQFNQQQHP